MLAYGAKVFKCVCITTTDAHHVVHADRIDLNHCGAVLAQQAAAERTRHSVGQVHDQHAGERAGAVVVTGGE